MSYCSLINSLFSIYLKSEIDFTDAVEISTFFVDESDEYISRKEALLAVIANSAAQLSTRTLFTMLFSS